MSGMGTRGKKTTKNRETIQMPRDMSKGKKGFVACFLGIEGKTSRVEETIRISDTPVQMEVLTWRITV